MNDDAATAPIDRVLATDLDGTLIPLPGDARNQADLRSLANQLTRQRITLVFVTGRHFESVATAITDFQLPRPHWIICDVGTSIFRRTMTGEFEPVASYQQHQEAITSEMPIGALRQRLGSIDGLRLQQQEKQGRFKLSYYADAPRLADLVDQIQTILDQADSPYSIVHSVDPFNGDGLIDLLPKGVSKAHALGWWTDHVGAAHQSIVFAGDSGNDLAAMTAGYRTIVVGNADRSLAADVISAHQTAGWTDRLHLSSGYATSGVLEGCQRLFGFHQTDSK